MIFKKRLQLAVDKFFNDYIKNGKKRDSCLDQSHPHFYIYWNDLSML